MIARSEDRFTVIYPALAIGLLTAAFVIIKTGRDALFFQGGGIFQLPVATMIIAAASLPLAKGVATHRQGACRTDQGHHRQRRPDVDLDDEYPAAWNNLGILHLGQQQYGAAQAALRKATRLRPNYALGYYNLGVALDLAGEYDEAIEAYSRAVTLDPRLAALRFNPQVATNQHQLPIFLGRLQEQHAVLGGALDDAAPPR